MTPGNIKAILGPDGLMAQKFPHYEIRQPQIEMAQRVQDAIAAGTSAIIEAPTGIGKSFAYLVPAILSGKQVIVSTGYKTLQNQLVASDVPALQDLLDLDITVEVAKGRNNYICHHKWFKYQQEFAGIEEADRQALPVMDEIQLKLADNSFQGDIEFLTQTLPAGIRSEVVSFPDDCLQHRCRYAGTECYVNAMRARAFEAQLIITNHHLLLHALLMSREMGEPMFLPEADVYVIDEAHHLEQVATNVFSLEVTSQSLGALFGRDMFRRIFDVVLTREETNRMRDRHQSIVAAVSETVGEDQVLTGDLDMMAGWAAEMREAVDRMEARKDEARRQVTNPEEFEAECDLAIVALQKQADIVRDMAQEDAAFVRYVEDSGRRNRNVVLKRAPLLPEEELRDLLFDTEGRAVICTSATLTANGSFAHFKRQCGLTTRELPTYRLDYIFNYAANALLYQPAMPDYDWQQTAAYYDAVAEQIRMLLEVSRGRTLCLFTSWNGLDRVTSLLQSGDRQVIWPLRSQREGQKRELLQWFRDTPHSVLCATRSFWEGIDIPGDSLVSVVLDKLPFPNPRDPIHRHRQDLLQDMYGEGDRWWSFREYVTPHMSLALQQGFGRLLRRASDRGVVTVLDTRLWTKRYGQDTRREDLPPTQFTRRIGDVHAFFQKEFRYRADYGLNLFPGDRPSVEFTVLRDGKTARMELEAPSGAAPVPRSAGCLAEALGHLRARIEGRGRQADQFRVEIRCPYTRDQLVAASPESPGAPLTRELQAWAQVYWIHLAESGPQAAGDRESQPFP